MASWLILLIKQFVDIFKYVIIGNAIFYSNRKRNFDYKEIISLIITIVIIYIVLYNYINKLWVDINALICMMCLFCIFRNSLLRTIKIVIITILVTTLCDQVIVLLIGTTAVNENMFRFLLLNIVRLLIIIVISCVIKVIYNNKYNLLDMPWYIYMNIIFGFSATIFPLYIVKTYKYIINSRILFVIVLVAYLNVLVSIISIILFIKNKNEKEKYYLDNKIKDRTIKLQEDYFHKLIDNYSDIRKFKHDVKGHLRLVYGLMNKNNYGKAKDYINKMSKMINSKDIYSTNNIYISTILNSFDQIFKDENIKFELSYYITKNINMDSMDICSLFYNLISNAIEANLKIKNNRYINLYIADIKNNAVIKVVNPIDEYFDFNFIKENRTSKLDKENHGFGMITINNIIEKYNGSVDYSIANQVLIIDITLLNVLK